MFVNGTIPDDVAVLRGGKLADFIAGNEDGAQRFRSDKHLAGVFFEKLAVPVASAGAKIKSADDIRLGDIVAFQFRNATGQTVAEGWVRDIGGKLDDVDLYVGFDPVQIMHLRVEDADGIMTYDETLRAAFCPCVDHVGHAKASREISVGNQEARIYDEPVRRRLSLFAAALAQPMTVTL